MPKNNPAIPYISAAVNKKTKAKFVHICEVKGISRTEVMSTLVNNYIAENKALLHEPVPVKPKKQENQEYEELKQEVASHGKLLAEIHQMMLDYPMGLMGSGKKL